MVSKFEGILNMRVELSSIVNNFEQLRSFLTKIFSILSPFLKDNFYYFDAQNRHFGEKSVEKLPNASLVYFKDFNFWFF